MTTVKMAAKTGAGPWRPFKSSSCQVPRRSAIQPISMKKAAVMMPWFNISNTAPESAWVEKANVPNTMKPTCANEE